MANVLNADAIAALLARSKTKGDYDAELADFLKSGEAGVEVSLTEGRFQGRDDDEGKGAKNLVVGLNNARKRQNEDGSLVHAGGGQIKVIHVPVKDAADDKNHVYMINTAVAGGTVDDDE